MNYETTFQIEILKEYGASISAAFSRFADEASLDYNDDSNPIIQAEREAAFISRKLIGSSNEQIAGIKNRLNELKEFLFEVNPNAVI